MCVKVCVKCVDMCVYSPTSVHVCVYMCVCMCMRQQNHRLIGAIRELAEQHSIAAPDGQLEVDTLHVDTHCTYTKHTRCIHS